VIERLEQEAPLKDDDEYRSQTPARKLITMPRSRYIDDHGMPVHPVFGPFRFWPREMQADFNNYSRYLDRLWSRRK